MIRSEILKEIAPILRDQLVVCNIGIPSQELHAIDDQPTNFYMLGTMGLASSIGLGLALAQPKPVIVIDGDGREMRQRQRQDARDYNGPSHNPRPLYESRRGRVSRGGGAYPSPPCRQKRDSIV